MQTIPYDHRPRSRGRRLGVSTGAILGLLALAAVVIVGYLLIRGGGNEVEEQAQRQTEQLQQGFDAEEARTRLATLRSDIEAGLDETALRERYEGIRSDLETAYADAEGDAAEAWGSLSPRLDDLGEQIGQASEDAVATIDAMLADFPEE